MYKIRPLNLPPFHVKLREEGLKNQIFDPIRQKYVALTPEEWVRQHFVNYLTEYLEYPKGMIANEVMIRLNGTEKRCDTIVYSSSLQPLLIVEYKAPSVGLSKRVLEQIIRYNMVLHVRFLLHVIAGAVSADSHHVIDVDDIFNQVWVLVDDGDLVVHGQMPRQCHAHLSRAHDHDLHNVRPFSCREIPISAQSQHIITDMPANAISFFVNFLRVCPPGAVTSLNNVRCACGCFLPAPPDSPKILLDKPAQTA